MGGKGALICFRPREAAGPRTMLQGQARARAQDALAALRGRLGDAAGVEAEFGAVPDAAAGAQMYAAQLPQNQGANRYYNVSPYDRNRVVLRASTSGRDYINASWVESASGAWPGRYIACQGPLEETAGDFWQMVVEQGAPVIVQLTNFVEDGRLKCFQYVPLEAGQAAAHGGLTVTVRSVRRLLPGLEHREVAVAGGPGGGTHAVDHFLYTDWPDFGVPESSESIRRLLEITREKYGEGQVPVVHCSAGIGRTGVFCVLDITLKRLYRGPEGADVAGVADLAALLGELRGSRMGMVQTLGQYTFCYEALVADLEARAA